MAFIIQLQGHRWVKGMLHKTLLSHQRMAASQLYNNVISKAGKVFEALPTSPSLRCHEASVVKRLHKGEYEHGDTKTAGAFPTLSLLFAIYPFLFHELSLATPCRIRKYCTQLLQWRGKRKGAGMKWLPWSGRAGIRTRVISIPSPRCVPCNKTKMLPL